MNIQQQLESLKNKLEIVIDKPLFETDPELVGKEFDLVDGKARLIIKSVDTEQNTMECTLLLTIPKAFVCCTCGELEYVIVDSLSPKSYVFEIRIKDGKPVATIAQRSKYYFDQSAEQKQWLTQMEQRVNRNYVSFECPLCGSHVLNPFYAG